MINFASLAHNPGLFPKQLFSILADAIEREVDVHAFVRPFTVLQTKFAVDSEYSDPDFTEELTEKLLQVPSPVVNRLALGLDIPRRSQLGNYCAKVFGRTMLIGFKARRCSVTRPTAA